MGVIGEEERLGKELNGEENEEEIDPKTIVERIRAIVKGIRCSPQKRIKFEETVRIAFPEIFIVRKTVQTAELPRPNIVVPTRPSSARIAR